MNMLDTAVAITARRAGMGASGQQAPQLDPSELKKIGDLAQKIWANEATWGDTLMFNELCAQNGVQPDDFFPEETLEVHPDPSQIDDEQEYMEHAHEINHGRY